MAAAVSTSLEKLPADRFESAAAFSAALTDTGFVGSGRSSTIEAPTLSTRPWKRLAAGTTALAAALLSLVLWTFTQPPAENWPADLPVHRFVATDLADVQDYWFDVSRDGSLVVRWEEGGRRDIRLRPADALEFRTLPGTDGALNSVVVSPDGASVAYTVPGEGGFHLRTQPLAGGPPVEVAVSDAIVVPIAWEPDGFIYGHRLNPGGAPLFRVDDQGGALEPLEVPLPAGASAVSPIPIPGSSVLIYLELRPENTGRVMAYDRNRGDTVEITRHPAAPILSPTGHLLVSANGVIQAIAFDAERMETGEPVPVLTGAFANPVGMSFAALSPTGTLAYVEGPNQSGAAAGATRYAEFVGPDGTAERLPMRPISHDDARISPDGSRLAYTRGNRVWVLDLVTGANEPFPDDEGDVTGHHDPVWSPDGRYLAFNANHRGESATYVYAVDGSEPPYPVATLPAALPSDWHEDGMILLFTEILLAGRADIYTVRAGEPGSLRPLLAGDHNELLGIRSPDGRWMAYISDETGTRQLWIRSFPDLTTRLMISEEALGPVDRSAQGATWSPDGREIMYLQRDGNGTVGTRVAQLDFQGGVRVARRRTAAYGSAEPFSIRDRHPVDGRILRFRQLAAGEAHAPRRLIVITNWLTELRAQLEAGNE